MFSRMIYSRRRAALTSFFAQHHQFRLCRTRISMRACIRACAHRTIAGKSGIESGDAPCIKMWREYTCVRLLIAPQSLLSASAYLFTARCDIFRIDVRRIYVTWESHKVLLLFIFSLEYNLEYCCL